MKRLLYIFLLALLPLATAISGENVQAEEGSAPTISKADGDRAYSEERYQDAIAVYEELIGKDGGSLELHYNLGNAYFRDNEIGKAILNYERALKFDPTDENAAFNLEFAQSRMKDKLPESDTFFLTEWFTSFVGIFNITVWAVIGIATFVLMLTGIAVYIFSAGTARKLGLTTAIVSLFITVVANLSALSLYNIKTNDSYAIVIKEEVTLKSSPDASGTDLIKVHEGRKVKVLDKSIGKWTEVEVDNGKLIVGWVRSSSIESI